LRQCCSVHCALSGRAMIHAEKNGLGHEGEIGRKSFWSFWAVPKISGLIDQ
jgi:hypothetical protein